MKSIWKSKSFITGVVMMVFDAISTYGIEIPVGISSHIIEIVAIFLIGKSAAKRMSNGS